MTYATFKKEWTGRRVDYDHVYGYQCVDLILEWCKENGIPSGVWGNAIDYATHPTATFTKHFADVTKQTWQPGDVVVLKGLAGNPFGHIGLFDHASLYILEQNATGSGDGKGRSAIGVYRNIPKSRIARVWRFKTAIPKPKPAPARSTVFLPSSAGPWHLYHVGSSYNPNDRKAVLGILRPDIFKPGLTYKIESWIGNNAVVIQTHDFGRGVVWVKGTSAVIK
ncbi:MAG TPA: CHAP domain-containing protein [Candidatus Saccharimonadales bacterium]|nr:CHAP domain-containing protein [Candidatus Saccharimonadales bacterium]